mmetsp:Transcript_20325/g.53070  ORF Transcript_20325/g.53070 Transcript_20325/m.53070 type:complete len:420 (-) Transcript_20325:2-1261(-)
MKTCSRIFDKLISFMIGLPHELALDLGLGDEGAGGVGGGALGRLGLGAGGLAVLLLLLLDLAHDAHVRVELLHLFDVLQRVLLHLLHHLALLGRVDGRLDLIGVDDAGKVRVGHLRLGEDVALLEVGGGGAVAEDRVELGEGGLGPDAEAAHVAARRELEKVEALDLHEINAGQVAGGELDALLRVVDDERAAAHGVAAVAHLALASAELLRLLALGHVGVAAEGAEDLHDLGGLGDGLEAAANDERHLRHLVDLVAAGHHERRDRRGGEGRGHGVAALVEVDLAVPLAPDASGGEHAAAAAHVTEGGLARALGAATLDARNTRDGTAGTPRLSRGLVAGSVRHGVRLAVVLGHVRVNEADKVRADRGREDRRERGLRRRGAVLAEDRDHRACFSHFEGALSTREGELSVARNCGAVLD